MHGVGLLDRQGNPLPRTGRQPAIEIQSHDVAVIGGSNVLKDPFLQDIIDAGITKGTVGFADEEVQLSSAEASDAVMAYNSFLKAKARKLLNPFGGEVLGFDPKGYGELLQIGNARPLDGNAVINAIELHRATDLTTVRDPRGIAAPDAVVGARAVTHNVTH
jgi:hypothetical protein